MGQSKSFPPWLIGADPLNFEIDFSILITVLMTVCGWAVLPCPMLPQTKKRRGAIKSVSPFELVPVFEEFIQSFFQNCFHILFHDGNNQGFQPVILLFLLSLLLCVIIIILSHFLIFLSVVIWILVGNCFLSIYSFDVLFWNAAKICCGEKPSWYIVS